MTDRIPLRARAWDAFQSIVGDNEEKQRAIARFIRTPGRVLEIGCATANVAGMFREFDYVGVDIDAKGIALARHKFPGRNYRFHCLDILEDPLPDDRPFDYVLISHTAHHLPDPYFRRILEKSADLLVEGGKLVILDMVRPEPEEPWNKQLFYKLDRGEHFRNIREFEEILAGASRFEAPRIEIVKNTKLGIEVIDDVLIETRRGQGSPEARP